MMRYVALAKAPRTDAGDGHYRDLTARMDVLVSDDRAVDTGLLNAAGQRLFRAPKSVPFGFRGKET